MNKRLLCLLSVLLVGGLLLSSIAVVSSSKRTRWKWYIDKQGGYKLKYPAGADWEAEAEEFEDETGTGFFVSKWIKKEKTFISFGVGFFRESDHHLSTYEEATESPYFKCLELSNITLDGFPAAKAVFSDFDTLGYYKSICILTKKEGNCYEIYYESSSQEIKKTEKYFREYLPIANEMINSFRFL